jgi:predicted enzyme related to lactoylglutathione lyase
VRLRGTSFYTTDIGRAGKFYESTIGWSTQATDMGSMGTYTLFNGPGEKNNKGGMMAIGPQMKGVPPGCPLTGSRISP